MINKIENSIEFPGELATKNITNSLEILEKVFLFREKRRMQERELHQSIINQETLKLPEFQQRVTKINRINPTEGFRQFMQSEFATKKFQRLRRANRRVSQGFVLKLIESEISSVKESLINVFEFDISKLVKNADNWDFNIYELERNDPETILKSMGFFLFIKYGLILRFRILPETLLEFLGSAEATYSRNRNPYHDSLHAADTIQTVHYILSQTGIMNTLADLDIFAVFFAGIVLHIDSPGVSNEFQVEVRSEYAILYNDRKINENRCLNAAFCLLRNRDCDIVRGLSRLEYKEFRTLVIELVLTDMSTESIPTKYLENIRMQTQSPIEVSGLLANILHLSENGHYGKNWTIHSKRIKALTEERQKANQLMETHSKKYCNIQYSASETDIADENYHYLLTFFEPRMRLMTLMILHNIKIADKQPESVSDDSDSSGVSCGSNNARSKSLKNNRIFRRSSHQPQQRLSRRSLRKSVLDELAFGLSLDQQSTQMPWDIHISGNKEKWKKLIVSGFFLCISILI